MNGIKDVKFIDSRPLKGSWAPGKYYSRCRDCDDMFIGDKRAQNCAPCAYGDKKKDNQ